MAEPKSSISPSEWTLDHRFTGNDGNLILGSKPDCAVGVYLVEGSFRSGLLAPACPKCEFTGDLDAVFNPGEEKIEQGAPGCFKRAAAAVLTIRYPWLLEFIRESRPDTAEMIDQYAPPSQEP